MNTEIQETNDQTKSKEETLAKIAVTKEADNALVDIQRRVHEGFDAGKATKQELASLIILRFARDCTESDIHVIRAQFFDPILLMEATLKKAKETGSLPGAIRELLYEQFVSTQAGQPAAKRTKKGLPTNHIKDMVREDEESA